LADEFTGRLEGDGLVYLSRIQASAQQMSSLIDDMLKLSQVASAELRRDRVNLSGMAAEILADLQRAQPGRDVSLAVADGLVGEGDPGLLRLALQNLLANAWK